MELTKHQERALRLRAGGEDWGDIARRLKIRQADLLTWREQPEFASGLERAREEYLEEQMARLMAMLPAAITKLGEALEKGGDTARMKAIELLAKWTGLAGGRSEKSDAPEGGISLDELIRRQRDCLAALESEDATADGG